MHYVWHRSRRTNTALPCIHCSSRFTPGDVVYLVYMSARLPGAGESVCCFVASPGKNRGQWSIECAHGQISFLPVVVFHSIKLSIKSQHTEREEARKRKVSPLSVRTVRRDWKRVQLFFFLWISRLCADHIILHVNGKDKPTHTHNRGNIAAALSASLESIAQIS